MAVTAIRPEEITSEFVIVSVMNRVVDEYLIPHFLQMGLEATGEWRANVKTRAEITDTGASGVISGRKYTEQLVYGRKPGENPPIEPLRLWAMAKLGLDPEQAKSAAFAISKKIAKEGTEIYKQGGTDLIEYLSSPTVVSAVRDMLGGFVTATMTNYLERTIKNSFK